MLSVRRLPAVENAPGLSTTATDMSDDMHEELPKTPLKVTVYSDYICPFCYIGYLRLEKLRDEYDLDTDWRFLEIHPDNPPEGRPLSELGYPPHHWDMLMANLERMAREEGVALAERTFTTNSRLALELAQAVREQQPDVFASMNRALYEAYFVHRENIGDPAVLRSLAEACGVDRRLVEGAWTDPRYDEVLDENQRSAARLRITGTPSYVFGDRVYGGALPVEMLREAAARSVSPARP
jgi:predicted DsbA family dithiol-disulfide isomerase